MVLTPWKDSELDTADTFHHNHLRGGTHGAVDIKIGSETLKPGDEVHSMGAHVVICCCAAAAAASKAAFEIGGAGAESGFGGP